MNVNSLILSCIFSCIGLGFFTYGKKQRAIVPLGCGIGLVVFPYFVSDVLVMILIGVALIAIPYFIKIE
ncbi:MAG: hypothetical protein RLZZ210_1409 [Pseudomonadota bacterium]|jgi:uncharacterized membrane protein